jgi:hypothetical protein
MMYFGSLASTLASAESFVAVTRVGTLVVVSSLVWQTVRTVFSVNTKKKEVFAM